MDSHIKSLSDAELIQQYLDGQHWALTELWLRYDSLVYGLTYSLVNQREAAEDLRQEIFIKVLEHLPDLHEPDKFVSWLRSVTYNTCRSWLRRCVPQMTPLEDVNNVPGNEKTTLQSLEQQEEHTLLGQAISRLPAELRAVVHLFYFEAQKISEIATFLDIPETTVKWRLHAAREKLRQIAAALGLVH